MDVPRQLIAEQDESKAGARRLEPAVELAFCGLSGQARETDPAVVVEGGSPGEPPVSVGVVGKTVLERPEPELQKRLGLRRVGH